MPNEEERNMSRLKAFADEISQARKYFRKKAPFFNFIFANTPLSESLKHSITLQTGE